MRSPTLVALVLVVAFVSGVACRKDDEAPPAEYPQQQPYPPQGYPQQQQPQQPYPQQQQPYPQTQPAQTAPAGQPAFPFPLPSGFPSTLPSGLPSGFPAIPGLTPPPAPQQLHPHGKTASKINYINNLEVISDLGGSVAATTDGVQTAGLTAPLSGSALSRQPATPPVTSRQATWLRSR